MIDIRRAAGALAFALLAGCSSTYEGQRDLAWRQLEEAETAGAPESDLEQVEATLELARDLEERAAADQEAASEDLEWARGEAPGAQARREQLEHRRAQVDGELADARADLRDAEADRDALLAGGREATDAEDVAGVRVRQRRVEALETELATLDRRLVLAELDRRMAEDYARGAELRLEAARERIALAGALYDLAEQQAGLAGAEAHRARRGLDEERVAAPAAAQD